MHEMKGKEVNGMFRKILESRNLVRDRERRCFNKGGGLSLGDFPPSALIMNADVYSGNRSHFPEQNIVLIDLFNVCNGV